MPAKLLNRLPTFLLCFISILAFFIDAPSASAVQFTSVGTTTWQVPSGVRSITIKTWGAGGGGGGSGSSASSAGGNGAGAGAASTTVSVTPLENLSVLVGGGGGGGVSNASCVQAAGGGGGGYSGVHRSYTYLVIAGAGAGGGSGSDANTEDGGPGGVGGGTTGGDGTQGLGTGGDLGNGGTSSAGGTGGAGVTTGGDGATGASLQGGVGGQNGSACTGAAGTLGGGAGGGAAATNGGGGGGGGGGYFGGGGGEAGTNSTAETSGGGGGGGSSLFTGGASLSGSGTTAGGSTDADYVAGKGAGGTGGAGGGATNGNPGGDGLVVIIVPPTVTTQDASSIGATSATFNGTISATGDENATVRGFAWGTSNNMTGDTATTTDTSGAPFGTGAFTDSSQTLTCNTTYYYRPYATNSAGTGYGPISNSFTTSACSSPPTVTTNFANPGATTATLYGTKTGGENATQHGFAWGTSSTMNGDTATTSLGALNSNSSFSSGIAGLTEGLTYYFRAYATGATGSGYGIIRSFVTGNTTASRNMRLFEGFTIKLRDGRIILNQRQ